MNLPNNQAVCQDEGLSGAVPGQTGPTSAPSIRWIGRDR